MLRETIVIWAVAVSLLGCSADRASIAAGSGPQWSQSGFSATKSGQSPYKGPAAAKLKWMFVMQGGWGSDVSVGHDGTASTTHWCLHERVASARQSVETARHRLADDPR